jgi:hypothetical protein
MKCKLCEAIKNEKPVFTFEDYIILSTKNMKGHHKRVMIVSKEHKKDLPPIEKQHVMNVFILFCQNYFDEEPTFAMCEPTYATIPEHWHIIACDWFATTKELQQLHYTPHLAIKTKKEWKP